MVSDERRGREEREDSSNNTQNVSYTEKTQNFSILRSYNQNKLYKMNPSQLKGHVVTKKLFEGPSRSGHN